METINLIKVAGIGSERWINIDNSDLVKILDNDSLKIISDEMITKYDIKVGDDINKLRELENFEDDLVECEYADKFFSNWVKLDTLKDNEIYIDDYSYTFFNKSDIEGWDEDEGYFYSDGSNYKLLIVEDKKEFKVEEINKENYQTGTVITYKTECNKIFKIDDSMYQGTLLEVEREYNNIIEDI